MIRLRSSSFTVTAFVAANSSANAPTSLLRSNSAISWSSFAGDWTSRSCAVARPENERHTSNKSSDATRAEITIGKCILVPRLQFEVRILNHAKDVAEGIFHAG